MKSQQAPDPQQHQVPANPRLPNRPLLIISGGALVVWMIVLVLIALRAI
jgi:hypothetical protein